MAPRADGTLLVSQEIQDLFKDVNNGGRESVLKMWNECGFNKDPFMESLLMWVTNWLVDFACSRNSCLANSCHFQ